VEERSCMTSSHLTDGGNCVQIDPLARQSFLKMLRIHENVRFWFWRSSVAPSDAAERNRNMDAQIQFISCI